MSIKLLILACLVGISTVAFADTNTKSVLSSFKAIPSLSRLYSFHDLSSVDSPVPEFTGKDLPVRYEGSGEARTVAGRWAGSQAIRIDSGCLAGEPFNIGENGFSAEIWLRPNGVGTLKGNGGADGGTIISTGIGYWDGWRVTAIGSKMMLSMEIGRPSPVNAMGMAAGIGLYAKAWNHLVATWDRKTMRLYLNGLLVGEAAYEGDYYSPPAERKFRIGYAGYGIGSLDMDVDVVAIYDRALSSREVLSHSLDSISIPDSTYNQLSKAQNLFATGRYADALTSYKKLTRISGLPTNLRAMANYSIATCLMKTGRPMHAAELLYSLATSKSTSDWIKPSAGTALIGLLKADGASLKILEKAVKMPGLSKSDVTELRIALVRAYSKAGHQALARKVMKVITVNIDKSDAENLLKLARISASADDNKSALEFYKSAAALPNAPAYLKSYASLCYARVLVKAGKLNDAAKVYNVVAKDPSAPESHRLEATECAAEVARLKTKLPARDPAAFRVKPANIPKPGLRIYISPKGDDSNVGSSTKPLATLTGARDRIRVIKSSKGLPKGGIEVLIRAGLYRMTKTALFEKQDSGTPSSPITYRASGKTVFTGGVRLAGLNTVTDPDILERLPNESRGKVVQIDLKANGVDKITPFKARGVGKNASPMSELFFNGQSMTIARYPNTGWLQTAKIIEQPSAANAGVFECVSDRYSRWGKAKDIRVLGYLKYLWADNTLPVSSVDASVSRITLAEAPAYGATESNMPFFFLNLLEEIDQPGEYYIDSENGIAYLYPPKPIDKAHVEISLLPEEAIKLVSVTNINLIGLDVELCSGNGISMVSCTDCLIAGCSMSKMGGTAVVANNVTRCGVLSSDIWTMGRGGVELSGGDRNTLVRGDSYVENCHIWDLSRIDRTYTPQVLLDGVGNRISYNKFHKNSSSAMRVEGNDHSVEYNDCYDLVKETDDQGGVDMFGNPSFRGNLIRFNYWHDIKSERPCGQAGVRLDDAISGTLIYGNVFRRCSEGQFGAVQIHGGKDNVVENNLFLDCNFAISFSQWDENRFKEYINRDAYDRLHKDIEISQPPYSTRYPELAELTDRININRIWANSVVDCGAFMIRDNEKEVTMANQIIVGDPGFVSTKTGNYTLKSDSPLLTGCGFRPIPFTEIGLYVDQYRKTIPAK